jgi:hypothetical protein
MAAQSAHREELMASYLTELDERKQELELDNQGWQIWYVPHHDRTVTWCARPRPLLNTDSPEQLQKLIDHTHDEPSDRSASTSRGTATQTRHARTSKDGTPRP